MRLILILLAAIGIAAIGLRLYLGREAESRLRPEEVVDFGARRSGGRDNVFAMCPPGFCTPPADRTSPVFPVAVNGLGAAWESMIAAQARVERVAADATRRRYIYIQRSAILSFPDIVTVELIDLGDGRSSLAIDSRSRYGRSDFGVNRRRVTDWVRQLENRLRERPPPGDG